MICASIGRVSYEEIIHRAPEFECVELRLDLTEFSKDRIEAIIKKSRKTIATFRPGKSDRIRKKALKKAISAGCDFLDVEIDSKPKYMKSLINFARKKLCGVIISYHNLDSTPERDELIHIAERAFKLGADIVKIACKTSDFADGAKLLSLFEKFPRGKICAFGIGERGKFSRIFARALGSPITYAYFGEPTAQGQFEYFELKRLIDEKKPPRYAVAGAPIGRSKSPELFEIASELAKKYDAKYARIHAKTPDEFFETARALKLDAANLTSPLKETPIDFTDNIDESVREIGAANAVFFSDSGIELRNFDTAGFRACLESLPQEQKIKKVLVLGAGGAARSAIYALKNSLDKPNILITNRTIEKARKLAEEFDCGSIEPKNIGLENFDLCVSTLPSGAEFDFETIAKKCESIIDANYLDSSLESLARKYDREFISGKVWLAGQAAPFFNRIIGDFDEEEFFEKAESVFDKPTPEKIALIGFPGSGKTSVGESLAEASGLDFVDSDELIERKTGKTIDEIFERDGDEKFREIEAKVVEELSAKTGKLIVSFGGGALESDENFRIITENFLCVYLFSSLERCLERISNKKRPVFIDKNPEKLYIARLQRYFCASDLIVPNEKAMTTTIEKIYEIID